ncbi:acyltransferase domain-containing protein [Streptomyces sp. MS1.AVA.1]|uniref:Acyltransferase domain-containing protein n=1 Tax=Streptomyces machairae TaxID=3134109 RepID=A0ABU8UUC1_9ACTN
MAGLLKALAVLRHGTIPASLYLEPLNPAIDFGGLGLEPVDRARPLRPGKGRRFVGVNSFGFGGANAHVVVGPPPAMPPRPRAETAGELPVIASGRSPQAAGEAARRLAARLARSAPGELAAPVETVESAGAAESGGADAFYDIAATAGVRRARHRYRRVALASSPHEAARILSGEGVTGEAVEHGRVGLVFVGNGSQWAGMAADLLDADPVFRAEVEAVDAALAPRLGWSVVAQLRRPADEWGLEATEVAQPLLFAVQAGIVAVLRERGVKWTVALGHSVGEVAAAYAVGALTLTEASWVIAERSRAQAATAGQGRMASAGLPPAEAERVLTGYPGLVVAAVNSPRDVAIAGPVNQLKALGEELAARDVFFRLMDLDYAFHSPAMERIRSPLAAALAGLARVGAPMR